MDDGGVEGPEVVIGAEEGTEKETKDPPALPADPARGLCGGDDRPLVKGDPEWCCLNTLVSNGGGAFRGERCDTLKVDGLLPWDRGELFVPEAGTDETVEGNNPEGDDGEARGLEPVGETF